MDLFRAIVKSHAEADRHLSRKESNARSVKGKSRWAQRRMLNDHGYFVMLFGQVENRIDSECEKLIAAKRAAAGWKARRLWDDADIDRMFFMQKVSLLCEKGQAVYNSVHRYYKKFRCKIAHGDSEAVGPIILQSIAPDLLRIARALRA